MTKRHAGWLRIIVLIILALILIAPLATLPAALREIWAGTKPADGIEK